MFHCVCVCPQVALGTSTAATATEGTTLRWTGGVTETPPPPPPSPHPRPITVITCQTHWTETTWCTIARLYTLCSFEELCSTLPAVILWPHLERLSPRGILGRQASEGLTVAESSVPNPCRSGTEFALDSRTLVFHYISFLSTEWESFVC